MKKGISITALFSKLFRKKTEEPEYTYREVADGVKSVASKEMEFINHTEVDETKLKGINNILYNTSYIIMLCAVIGIVMHFVTFCVVNGNSMYPTLQHGQHFVVMNTKSVDYGDIICYDCTGKGIEGIGDELIVKRVIGKSGDVIKCVDGIVYRNGVALDEDYVECENADFEPVTVGEDEIFVMGDNRVDSLDSRYIGCLPTDGIVGKEWFVWLSTH